MADLVRSKTELRPPWVNLARSAWLVVAVVSIALFLVSTINHWRLPLPTCVGQAAQAAECVPWTLTRDDVRMMQQMDGPGWLLQTVFYGIILVNKTCFILVGLLIYSRRSDDWVALLMSFMLVTMSLEGVQYLGAFQAVALLLYALGAWVFMILPFIFPDGRTWPRWLGWSMAPLFVLMLAPVMLPLAGISLDEQMFALWLGIIGLGWFGTAIFAVVYRYRRVSTPIEKQQTKWVMAGILGWTIFLVPSIIIAVAFPPSEPSPARLAFFCLVYLPVYLLTYLFLSGSIAFAILRYRLWDIDIFIRRTLIYSVLTFLLALIFFGVVIVLQYGFDAVTGQQSQLAIVLSTLAIAAIFNPLHTRIQGWIDRRFYRRKYDAQQVLAQFAITARDETDMNALTAELARVVQETLEPEQVNIWLHGSGQ